MNDLCRIQTGDRVGNDWQGPYWTPFAQAIADNYGGQVPWFFNENVTLAISPTRQTTLTPPQQNDVLIFGAYAQGTAGRLPFVLLQITHQESGVPWAVPNILPFFPVTAIAGINVNAMPNIRLPEAFFLPKGTQLKLDWTLLGLPTFGTTTGVRFTMMGVQLIRPREGRAPQLITMPNGERVRTDARLPLFMTMGLGRRLAGGTFALNNSEQRTQFLPPLDCDAEIHDLNTNTVSAGFSIGAAGASSLQVKISVMGAQKQWTPNLSPITAVFGGPGGGGGGATQAFPAMPYTKPYLLPKGRRIRIDVQNTSITATFEQPLVTFRGVRLCEY